MRVAPIWETFSPTRPLPRQDAAFTERAQRGPYTGRGARTDGLIGDRTRALFFNNYDLRPDPTASLRRLSDPRPSRLADQGSRTSGGRPRSRLVMGILGFRFSRRCLGIGRLRTSV